MSKMKVEVGNNLKVIVNLIRHSSKSEQVHQQVVKGTVRKKQTG